MSRLMGSHFHDWSNYNGVAFSIDLIEWGRKFSDFWVACVAWRFWLGALSNKGGRGQRNREEIGALRRLIFGVSRDSKWEDSRLQNQEVLVY